MLAMDRWLDGRRERPLEAAARAEDRRATSPRTSPTAATTATACKVSDASAPRWSTSTARREWSPATRSRPTTTSARLKPLRPPTTTAASRFTDAQWSAAPQDLPGRRMRLLKARRRPAADDPLADLTERPRQGDLRRPADGSAAEEHSDQGEPPRRLEALGAASSSAAAALALAPAAQASQLPPDWRPDVRAANGYAAHRAGAVSFSVRTEHRLGARRRPCRAERQRAQGDAARGVPPPGLESATARSAPPTARCSCRWCAGPTT